ncbi:hypothetical protein [Klebsiella quasipneumoniae]|uniref:hypothetical protein n=1 Tax=Klebsiella quasipneumoniae TaxID=1463165 RepID=UPI003890CEC2
MQNRLDNKQRSHYSNCGFFAARATKKNSLLKYSTGWMSLTINEIKEVPDSSSMPSRFPRSLNALGVLMGVVEQRQQQELRIMRGKTHPLFPENWMPLKVARKPDASYREARNRPAIYLCACN